MLGCCLSCKGKTVYSHGFFFADENDKLSISKSNTP